MDLMKIGFDTKIIT